MVIVVLLLLAAAGGFVLRVTGAREELRSAIPPVSHPVAGEMADCLSCHEVGEEGMPRSHRTYEVPTCLTCHRVVEGE